VIDPKDLSVEWLRGDNQNLISVVPRDDPDAWEHEFTPVDAIAYAQLLIAEATAALTADRRQLVDAIQLGEDWFADVEHAIPGRAHRYTPPAGRSHKADTDRGLHPVDPRRWAR
jgi:hypothetical protein